MTGPERLPVATGRRSTVAVWQALEGRRALLILAAVISAGAAALELVTPALLGTIVDDISDGGETRPIWIYGGSIAAAVVAASALGALGVLLASRVLERLLATLRERLVTTALRMPQERAERSGTGDLVSRASDDVAQVSEALSQVLPSLSRTVFTILLTLGGLFLLDWRFGLTFLAAVPLYWLALRWYLRLAPPLYAAERAAFSTRAHHLLSALKGLDTVLAYRLSGWHSVRIALSSWAVATWALRARTVQTMFAWRIDLAFVAVLSTVLFVGYGLVGGRSGHCGGCHDRRTVLPAPPGTAAGPDDRNRHTAGRRGLTGPHHRGHRSRFRPGRSGYPRRNGETGGGRQPSRRPCPCRLRTVRL